MYACPARYQLSHLASTNPTFQVEKEAGNFLEDHHFLKPARLRIWPSSRGKEEIAKDARIGGWGGGAVMQGDHEGTGGKSEQAQPVM